MIFNMTGGGTLLNFQVKTYPSETELKADNPKENTNGIITTTTMTSWVFSATEPTEPKVGMVWFSIDNASSVEFNALKNNSLQVYPMSAKQYVSGAWENKTAYIYQNGEWAILAYVMMKNGEYVATSFVDMQNAGSDQGVLSDGSGRLFTRAYVVNAALVLKSEDKISKNVNKLKALARLETGTGKGSYNLFFLSTYGTWPDAYNNQIVSSSLTESNANMEYILDLSNVTTDAYLWVACAMGGNVSPRVVIKDIFEVM